MASAQKYAWTRSDGTTGRAWRASWTGADGRKKFKRGFDRKGDAEDYATDREAETRHGTALTGERVSGRTTLGAWAQTWLASQEVKPTTFESYRYAVKRIEADLGGRTLASLRRTELQTWRKGLERRYAPRTGAHTAAILSMLLRAAVHDGLIEKSPMPSAKAGKSIRVVDPEELLSLEQVEAWGAAMPAHARAMPLVAASTGLRQGELLGLTVEHVDFLRRSLRVVQQIQGREFTTPKTAAGTRTVPLTQRTVDAISAHLAAYPAPEGEPIFRTMRGRRWSRSGFNACWTKAARNAHLHDWVDEDGKKHDGAAPWAHWHALRDVAASALIRSGADLLVVMSVLGHTSSEETLRTYARLWPDSLDVAREGLDRMFR